MKKILLALLSLMLVLFPSCDNEVKETAPEPDYANNRTTIAIYKDGEVLDTEWDDYMMYFMRPLSKDKLSDSATFTVKNTGPNPAKVTIGLRSWRPGCAIESSIPDVLKPGESAEFTYTYSADKDIAILPESYLSTLNVYGNFQTQTIDFRGVKDDMPVIKVSTNQMSVNSYTINVGTDEYRSQILKIMNYRDTGKRELLFSYNLYNNPNFSLKSIEIVGKDADVFSLKYMGEYNLIIGFTPDEVRKYEASIRFHLKSPETVEYVREMDMVIDVIEQGDDIFNSNELYLDNGRGIFVYNMIPKSDGHAYIHATVDSNVIFIEINENDQFVALHKNIQNGSGVPFDSWLTRDDNEIDFIAVNTNHQLNPRSAEGPLYAYCIERHSITPTIHSDPIQDLKLVYPTDRYLCQSNDYLVFANDSQMTLVNKSSYEQLPAIPTETPVRDVFFDAKYLDYTIAYDKSLRITRYRTEGGFGAGRYVVLEDGFTGTIKKIRQVDGGYYVLNDNHEVYYVELLNLGCKVEKILTMENGKEIKQMHFSGNSLYLYSENHESPVIYKYDVKNGQLVETIELGTFDVTSLFYLLERNGNLYFSTTCKTSSGKPAGYIRRIPLI